VELQVCTRAHCERRHHKQSERWRRTCLQVHRYAGKNAVLVSTFTLTSFRSRHSVHADPQPSRVRHIHGGTRCDRVKDSTIATSNLDEIASFFGAPCWCFWCPELRAEGWRNLSASFQPPAKLCGAALSARGSHLFNRQATAGLAPQKVLTADVPFVGLHAVTYRTTAIDARGRLFVKVACRMCDSS